MSKEEKKIAFSWPPKKCAECKSTKNCLLYEYYQSLVDKN